jgi:hypothetical protein
LPAHYVEERRELFSDLTLDEAIARRGEVRRPNVALNASRT